MSPREHALRDAANAVLACVPPELDAPEPYRFVPLRTAPDVLEEGWAMRHCVWSYVEAAKAGRVMLWSIRANGRRVATLAVWLAPFVSGRVAAALARFDEQPGRRVVAGSIEGLAWGLLFAVTLVYLRGQTAFIYFQF